MLYLKTTTLIMIDKSTYQSDQSKNAVQLRAIAITSKKNPVLTEVVVAEELMFLVIRTKIENLPFDIYCVNNLQVNLYPEKLMLLLHVCTLEQTLRNKCNYSDKQPNRKYLEPQRVK